MGKNENYSDVCMERVRKIKSTINLDTQLSWVPGSSRTGSDIVSAPVRRLNHDTLYNQIHIVHIRLKDCLKGRATTRPL